MLHDILIEGSSCSETYSDESGKGGFVGRITNHFREYCQENKRRNNWQAVGSWVYFSNHAQTNRLLPEWAVSLPAHVDEMMSRRTTRNRQTQRLGLFILEGHPLHLNRVYGDAEHSGRSLTHTWRQSLETVQAECSRNSIQPILMQMPVPERNISKLGREIYEELARISVKAAHSMEDAPYIQVTDFFADQNVEPFLADDRMHPNARGHELIFRSMLPLLYEQMGLEPRGQLPDPREVLELRYVT